MGTDSRLLSLTLTHTHKQQALISRVLTPLTLTHTHKQRRRWWASSRSFGQRRRFRKRVCTRHVRDAWGAYATLRAAYCRFYVKPKRCASVVKTVVGKPPEIHLAHVSPFVQSQRGTTPIIQLQATAQAMAIINQITYWYVLDLCFSFRVCCLARSRNDYFSQNPQ